MYEANFSTIRIIASNSCAYENLLETMYRLMKMY